MNDTGTTRRLPPLIAAAVLLVTAIGLVLVFGVVRPPALDDLDAATASQLPGSIAWARWGEDGNCVTVLAPGSEPREVWCSRDGEELVAWTEEGLVLRSWETGDRVLVVDPERGEVVDDRRQSIADRSELRSEAFRISHTGGTLRVVLRDDGQELWAVTAPEAYEIRTASRSPDGGWVTLVDGMGRLLVVPADGSQEPQVWAEVEDAWIEPVWESSPVPRG